MAKIRIPKDPIKAFDRINEHYFDYQLPQPRIVWVQSGGVGKHLDCRHAFAAVSQDENGFWLIELDTILKVSIDWLVLVLTHEMLHIKLGLDVRHGSKAWNEEVRRLTGLGFFNNVF